MDSQILSQKTPIIENGLVILEETIQTTKSKQDLINERDNYARQKLSLIDQSKRLKEQFDLLTVKETRVDELLILFEDEPVVVL